MIEGELKSEQGDFHALADFLDSAEGPIVETWINAVAKRLEKHHLDHMQVEDHIRLFLRHVSQRLRHGGTRDAESAVEHGHQRYSIGYELAQMLEEYGLLLDAVEFVAEEQGLSFSKYAYASFVRNVIKGSTEAALAFAALERTERQQLANRRFAFIAHELRTPIQNLELSLQSWASGISPERVRPMMERAVETLKWLVDRELVRAQAVAGSSPIPHAESFDMMELVAEVVSTSQPVASTKNVELAYEGPETLPVHLDHRMTWSVITNLVRNALKFSIPGGRAVVIAREVDEQVHIEVHDECGGLSDEAKGKIFEAFEQVGQDRTGFGLGLSIARQVCHAHGGDLSVHDRDRGCVFRAELPLRFGTEPKTEPSPQQA